MGFFREQMEGLGVGREVRGIECASYFGIWTQHLWIFWMNTTNSALPAWMPWQAMYLVLSIGLVLGALFTWTRERRGGSVDGKGTGAAWPDNIAGGLCAAATLLVLVSRLIVGGGAAAGLWAAAALVLGALGYAWLQLRWALFYARLDIRQAVAFLFGGGILAALAKVLLGALPLAASCIVAAFVGPASVAMVRASLSLPPRSKPARVIFTRQTLPDLWKVGVLFVVFSIANASLLSISPVMTAQDSLGVYVLRSSIEILLCAAVLLCVLKFRKGFDFVQLWRIVMVLLGADFVLNIVAPNAPFQLMFASMSLNFIVLFIWLTLSDIARHSSVHPYVVFAIGWCLYSLPFFVGCLLTTTAGIGSASVEYFAVLLFVMGVAMSFCLEPRDQNVQSIFCDLDEEGHAEPSDYADIDSRCEAIGKEKGLTPREIEVMQLLCKGRSKAYIAETLFVTENTVKGHAKHLYTKLDVHSKKELQELIGL